MSYAKQMIEVAQRWLRSNPDPKSPFLEVPGFDKNRLQSRLTAGQKQVVEFVDAWARDDRPRAILVADAGHGVTRAPLGESSAASSLTPDQRLRYVTAAANIPALAPHVAEVDRLTRDIAETRRDLNQHEAQAEDLINAPKPGQAKYEVAGLRAVEGRWCLTWARSGYNTLDLSRDFVAAMLLTDASALDVDLVRLPFPALLITMPEGFAIGAEGRSYTKIHVAEISATDLRTLHAGDQASKVLGDLSPDAARRVLEELRRDIGKPASLFDKVDVSRSLLEGPAVRPSAAAGALHIYATDGASVLETLIDRQGLSWEAFDDLPDTVDDDADRRARHTLRQVVFGALAYMSAVDRALEPRDPQAPRAAARSDRPRATQWTVGRTIRIDPQLVRLAQSGDRQALFRLKHRFIVRGHYRNQAHGPQRTLRTSKWITPFWKGPEDGAALIHTYKLEKKED